MGVAFVGKRRKYTVGCSGCHRTLTEMNTNPLLSATFNRFMVLHYEECKKSYYEITAPTLLEPVAVELCPNATGGYHMRQLRGILDLPNRSQVK